MIHRRQSKQSYEHRSAKNVVKYHKHVLLENSSTSLHYSFITNKFYRTKRKRKFDDWKAMTRLKFKQNTINFVHTCIYLFTLCQTVDDEKCKGQRRNTKVVVIHPPYNPHFNSLPTTFKGWFSLWFQCRKDGRGVARRVHWFSFY